MVIISVSCRKDKDLAPTREEFPLAYQFMNEGDENVQDVIFYTTTFYLNDTVDARGDTSHFIIWKSEAFNKVGSYGIVTMPVDKKGYAGCTGQLKFVIWFKEPVFSPVLFDKGYGGQNGIHPVGMTEARIYEGPVKTISSPADKIIQFKWPSDTVYYKEVLWL